MTYRDRQRASYPLILLATGYNKWAILGPSYNYGKALPALGPDRRYVELCAVSGTLHDATPTPGGVGKRQRPRR